MKIRTKTKALAGVGKKENLSRKAAPAAAKKSCGARSSKRHSKTDLSSLITNGVVLQGAIVQYLSKKKHDHPMGVGEITCGGIKCRCCDEVYGLTAFEAHCGSNYHRPAQNLFLEDGKSLMDCQIEMISKLSTGHCRAKLSPCDNNSNNSAKSHPDNDYTCAICHYEGDLILCDECPCSFHQRCIGLKDTPEGNWFCPWCCCVKCGKKELFCNDFEGNGESNGEKNDPDLRCYQCERRYHSDCLQIKGSSAERMKISPEEKWFCSKTCKNIFSGLSSCLGKSFPVPACEMGIGGLTWTLLRSPTSDFSEDDDDATYIKLNSALEVMHESFEPLRNSRTGKDVAEDVIFSRGSDDQARSNNFEGFYTAIVEKDGEVTTVATLRVFGAEVAEFPLVCSRLQYRGLGMCKSLMNELETMLAKLGVRRLILPAAPAVLSAWTTKFGFAKMARTERLELLDYTFLDFEDTTMCQKLLRKNKKVLIIDDIKIEVVPTYSSDLL